MKKPLLVVVTGRPAAGKTTLAHLLSREIKCPLFSRDELKEGYLVTLGIRHNELGNEAAWHIYDTFFETVDLLISKGMSIIIEAAFQNKLWKPKLLNLQERAAIRVIVCTIPAALAKKRFTRRASNDPDREKFHGDHSSDLIKKQQELLIDTYEPVMFNAPILEVDTTKGYKPDIKNIVAFIRQKNNL